MKYVGKQFNFANQLWTLIEEPSLYIDGSEIFKADARCVDGAIIGVIFNAEWSDDAFRYVVKERTASIGGWEKVKFIKS